MTFSSPLHLVQDHCGGCWAYALAESFRTQFVARHGIQNDPGMLSAEFLIDCASPAWTAKTCTDGANGCCGGTGLIAANWLLAVGGIPTAKEYGGRGHFDKNLDYNVTRSAANPRTHWPCNMMNVSKAVIPVGPPIFFAPNRTLNMTLELLQEEKKAMEEGGKMAVVKLFCEKFGVCPNADGKFVSPETAMAQYACDVGPVEIGTNDVAWQHYVSGVIDGATCGYTTQTHSTEVVGVDAKKQMWIVRNHWGPDFGVSPSPPYLPASETPNGKGGYVLLAFGENTCRMGELGFAHPELKAA